MNDPTYAERTLIPEYKLEREGNLLLASCVDCGATWRLQPLQQESYVAVAKLMEHAASHRKRRKRKGAEK